MFFTGDPTTRKRVDLGGRSTKERDAQKLLEQTRKERNRRLMQRQQNSAALKIQKFFRGRKSMATERSKVRQDFCKTYGNKCQNVDRHCFEPGSGFLQQLLFFFKAQNMGDVMLLVETCRLLQNFVHSSGDIVSLFSGTVYSSEHSLVDVRVKKLVLACIEAVHHNRNHLKDQLLVTSQEANVSTTLLLEAVVLLLDPKLPWVCKIVSFLLQRNVFTLFREIVTTAKESPKAQCLTGNTLSLERVLMLIVPHVGHELCHCPVVDPLWSFSSQILTIPFLWQLFPNLKTVFANPTLSQHYIHQMAFCVQNLANVLPADMSSEFASYACLLGNTLETASVALSQPNCSFEMALGIASVATFLLETLPPVKSSERENEQSSLDEDDMIIDEAPGLVLNRALEQQITNAMDTRFLLQLTNVLFHQVSLGSQSYDEEKEAVAIGAACYFLYATFNTLPLERIMTILAYRTELVTVLWNYMKRCHENQKWSSMSKLLPYLPGDAPGWLLPLVVFCPVYKHMLMIVDNEEFYEREKPLSLQDIRLLIIILKQALWQLLWVNPLTPSTGKSISNETSKENPVELIQNRVGIVVSELLSQLQDWNNRRQFTSSADFQADAVNDYFISQAVIHSTRANYILKQAPFLIPFTSRVKIFTTQLAAARQSQGSHGIFSRNRFRIRRDHILEDAYNQMSALSEDDLRGSIRVTFVNELGVEEAGIDGGGIFKDFMENIARAAFDVQYGLFKETSDHMLYPNPGSGMIHEQHLQFFHFLGSLLAKAMFEGILVDIPFATFFLSKLKQKYNYLNDLPSLDPELYRHLIFLKHYKGDISELELYFVIVNNEYGEKTEEELLPGGKDLRVTNENVITFIHLVSNHRLNFQIRQQSSHFLRGFQQLIQKEWIDMFNEHELQVLISGSLDSLDIEDLRNNANYAGGYHSGHYVVDMFWEVLKSFSTENQKKFLKFVTGCSRGPLLGFKYLEPLFCIQRAGGSATDEAVDRLPTSATCMNLLKLPPYRSKEQLETKVLYAINAEAGFDLS
ncbi:PREDICTED: E3 ubiquitin-protein ligase UPL6 [Tarenaya hassleriana]|uniref:E3 ubiquitin-protein ligase UPL6 n=1 Tax=Tarenaya hassleriana TaxID=28532 RepID=UPI00053C6853|nr:PREDICTED: E3 ubiquitin-protein ligase UPL6 [Tarenaya hassleriana]